MLRHTAVTRSGEAGEGDRLAAIVSFDDDRPTLRNTIGFARQKSSSMLTISATHARGSVTWLSHE